MNPQAIAGTGRIFLPSDDDSLLHRVNGNIAFTDYLPFGAGLLPNGWNCRVTNGNFLNDWTILPNDPTQTFRYDRDVGHGKIVVKPGEVFDIVCCFGSYLFMKLSSARYYRQMFFSPFFGDWPAPDNIHSSVTFKWKLQAPGAGGACNLANPADPQTNGGGGAGEYAEGRSDGVMPGELFSFTLPGKTPVRTAAPDAEIRLRGVPILQAKGGLAWHPDGYGFGGGMSYLGDKQIGGGTGEDYFYPTFPYTAGGQPILGTRGCSGGEGGGAGYGGGGGANGETVGGPAQAEVEWWV